MNKKLNILTIVAFFSMCNSQAQINTDSLKSNEKFGETHMYYTPTSKEALDLYTEGHDYFSKSEFRKSIASYIKAIELEPKFVDAMDNLGNSYRYLGILDSAEFWYNKSIAMYPNGYIAHQNLAIVYLSTSRLEKALNEYDTMILLDAENPEGYFGKANVYIQLKKGDEIVINAQKALTIYRKKHDPYEMDALYLIGVGYYIQGDNKSAIKYLKKAKDMGMEIPEVLQKLFK